MTGHPGCGGEHVHVPYESRGAEDQMPSTLFRGLFEMTPEGYSD